MSLSAKCSASNRTYPARRRTPAGRRWIHRDQARRLSYSRRSPPQRRASLHPNGYDFADRFPLAAAAVATLPVRSCVIDGEAIACDQSGLAVFELVRHQRRGVDVVLCAFDLLELDGKDMRHVLIEDPKLGLANLLRQPHKGIAFNEHYSGEGAIIFKHACALGCEGIVSKRLGSPYRSGRSPNWVKLKNPNAPAVMHEAEEDWR